MPIPVAALVVLACVVASLTVHFINRRKAPKVVRKTNVDSHILERQKAQRHASNALQLFVARTTRFAAGHRMEVVMPAALTHGGESCRLTLLLVSSGGVLGVKSLSMGGEIKGNVAGTAWTCTEAGRTTEFRNPALGCEADTRILKAVLAEQGLNDVPVTCVPVFVNPKAKLTVPANVKWYSDSSLFEALEQGSLCHDKGCDTAALAEALRSAAAKG